MQALKLRSNTFPLRLERPAIQQLQIPAAAIAALQIGSIGFMAGLCCYTGSLLVLTMASM